MQDYRNNPYDNRIYTRKYDFDSGSRDIAAPTAFPGTPQNYYDYSSGRQAGFTTSSRPWAQQQSAYGQAPTPTAYVSNFKSSREDDLLRKLDMYQQKYQMGGKPAVGARRGQQQQPFEAVGQIGGGQQQAQQRREARDFSYSYNQSPVREGQREVRDVREPREKPEEMYPRETGRFAQQPRYSMDPEMRPEIRPTAGLGLRSSYEDLNRSFQGARNFQPRDIRQTRDQPRIQYDLGPSPTPPQPPASIPRSTTFSNRYSLDQPQLQLQSRQPKPSYQPPKPQRYDLRPNQRPEATPKSRGMSVKSSIQQRVETREYRPRNNAGYDYRQGIRNQVRQGRRGAVVQAEEQGLSTLENQRVPMGHLRESVNQTNEEQTKPPRFRQPQTQRQDRLRDLRRKTPKDDPNSSFHLQRSQKKQSLKQRSQQLRQRLNQPSPMKQRLSSLNQPKQGKQNLQYQGNRYPNKRPSQKQPSQINSSYNEQLSTHSEVKERRKVFTTEQTDRQLTPSKTAKPELEEDTYRKIETINDLNNKINERIRHILSTFNQEPTC